MTKKELKKNILIILGSILITLVIVISIVILTYKLIPYSYNDADRVKDIVLQKTSPTYLDYIRLDMNKDDKINMLDALIIIKKVDDKKLNILEEEIKDKEN